ncbi:hypothetical protein GCM10025857_19100 [Alicyclobacillus contaminans]|nr:hypothetical protein GCM10025857_19100 [Alicyclobacillus contaminans]
MRDLALQVVKDVEAHLDEMQFSLALTDIWKVVRQANKYIDDTAPWSLHKQGDVERLNTVLYTMAEVIRMIAVQIQPFLPRTGVEILRRYQVAPAAREWSSLYKFGELEAGVVVELGEPLFPRLDIAEELAALADLTGKKAGVGSSSNTAGQTAKTSEKESQKVTETAQANAESKSLIGIDTFSQVELRVGQIQSAERIEGADKLLKLQVDLGSEVRQIVSGIAKHFTPESLVGQRVVVVTNLKPVKLRGVQSNGMILAASEGDTLKLVTVPEGLPNGAIVK